MSSRSYVETNWHGAGKSAEERTSYHVI